MKRWESYLLPLTAIFTLLLVWHFSVVLSRTTVFPAPKEVLLGFRELLRRGVLWSYTRDSLFRVGSGYLLAVCLGIPTGILMGWYPLVAAAFNPVIQMLRPISPLAWMPLAVVWFGVSDLAPIFLIFLAAFFPVVVSTMNGVRNMPGMYFRAGRNFGLARSALFARVIFPAILPQVLVGLRIALGIAWLVVVAAEMIAVNSGLGYLIIDSRNAGKRYDLVVAGMILIGVIGLGLDVAVRRTERLKSVRWGFRRGD
ncbi:MAG TPA: ABC transporter permease [Acidobacteriota bacterium]|jgi:NitT/TauT family transport system permease protein|nr:ABC transporter permease [Acidobacteriota bacterium]